MNLEVLLVLFVWLVGSSGSIYSICKQQVGLMLTSLQSDQGLNCMPVDF